MGFDVPCSQLGLVGEDGNTRLYAGSHVVALNRGPHTGDDDAVVFDVAVDLAGGAAFEVVDTLF